MNSVKLAVPKDRMNQAVAALRDFQAWSEVLLKEADFSGPETVYWADDRNSMLVLYTAPPSERFGTAVGYKTIAEAIFRTVAVRSRRRNPDGTMTPVPDGWWPIMTKAFAPLFGDCRERDVGDGWIDLTLALADWCWSLDQDRKSGLLRFREYTDRDGELRIDAAGYDDKSFEVLESFEWLSAHVCETCGAPGKTYGRGAIFPAVTACVDHKPADADGDEE